ncbi:hypothetical protein [Paenibacillus sp. ISL-20]|uniref:hypothetical protein n=1 Tax=Paenibacillus sp. ISL-20 TaxID=2819163 RepID=UPI002551F2BB|nr:hypothetical protein [Paenibacillus sp. ISL-20]
MTEHYYNVAVVGATGAVGQQIPKLLEGHQRRLNMWIVSDHLLEGAAWNAVLIAEIIVNKRNGQA